MLSSRLGRFAVVGAAVLGFVGVIAACDDGPDDGGHFGHGRGSRGEESQCDAVMDQCIDSCLQTDQCDDYSCQVTCEDQCHDACDALDGGTDAASDAATVVTDASPPSDGGTVVIEAGSGVLCSPCISNNDCESNALCILRGGATDDSGVVGNGFCATSCVGQGDCPTGFLCSQIGSSRQCLPTGNACQ